MYKWILLIITLSLIACWPFFKKGYFRSHDGEWMVIRFSAFHQTLTSGQFPVRFLDRLNNNYGYPVTNFLYPLPFYLAEAPKLLGFGYIDSIKIIFVLSTITSALAMFWATNQLFGQLPALTSAILYIWAPYRFVDLYVRGSIGEIVAFVFPPLILGSLIKIANGNKKFLPILSISIGLLILAHNVIAAIFIPFFLTSAYFLIRKNFPKLILYFVIGIALAAFFWIPALYDLRFVRLSQIKVSEIDHHLVNLKDLILPRWGFGPRPAGDGSFSPQIGLALLAVFVASVFLRLKLKHKEPFFNFILIIFVISSLLMLKVTLPLWALFPFIDTIQFPWRLLSLIVFLGSFLAAYVVYLNKRQLLITALLTIAAIVSTITYTHPQSFTNRPDSYYSTNEDTTTVRDEYLPLWIINKPSNRPITKIEVIQGQASISNLQVNPNYYQATITADEKSQIQVNTIYFPGWQVKINGKNQKIDYQNPQGVISFELPKGIHKVIISYNRSTPHFLSELVSLAAFVAIGYLIYKSWLKKGFS